MAKATSRFTQVAVSTRSDAGLGNDIVYSLANDRRADEITYGEGINVVFARAPDVVADGCETVIRLGADVKGSVGDDS